MNVIRVRRSSVTSYVALLVGISAALLLWPGMFRNLFVTRGFSPHGYCVLWQPNLIWLYTMADTLIGFSYVAISFTLAYLVYRARRDIPFSWVFLAFGGFIIACGGTHFMDVWTLWVPTYWLSGYVKLITAAASVATALVLPPLVPRALRLVSDAKMSEDRQNRLESAHRELELLYAKSTELDQLKSQFFAGVSHELRTPLTLILGPTRKLIRSQGLSEEQQHYLEVIERNAATLLRQVNDLLDVAKLEAGKMELEYADADLAVVARTVAAHFDVLADEKQVDFAVDTPPVLPARLDAEKIARVLLNLLSNAFTFTPNRGRIQLALRREGAHAIVEVQDSGPGVRPEQRELIFERFRQGDGSATRRHGGTGLGLSIVKAFVELHGGSVAVTDAPVGGALFRVDLPLQAPANTDPGAHTEILQTETLAVTVSPILDELRRLDDATAQVTVSPSQPTVLVVEDHPDMRRFVAEILTDTYRVLTAPDGAEGLRIALEHHPDLILTDVMMPDMSGDQLVRAVRTHTELDQVPIMLLSAMTDEEFRVRVLREGAQDYVLKPFAAEELLARVGNLITTKRARQVLQEELKSQSQDIAGLADEVAARRRAQEQALDALRHSEARFRRLVEANIIGVIVADLGGAILEANDAFLRMVGYSGDDQQANSLRWDTLTPPEYRALDEQIVGEVKVTGRSRPAEKEYVRKDGSRVPVLLGVALLDGTEDICVCFVLDLTEQKRVEEQQHYLAEASAFFASSLEYEATLVSAARLVVPRLADWSAIDIVEGDERLERVALVHRDPDAEVLMSELWSRSSVAPGGSVSELLRAGNAELITSMPPGLVAPQVADALPARAVELIGGPGILVPLVARERLIGIMVLGRRGGERAYDTEDVAFALDLARRAALALDNARLYSEAQEAIVVRDEFLSVASHELKTPVTALLGYTQVLERRLGRNKDASERDLRALRVIMEQSERLSNLIGTLLDLSRVQRGVFTIEPRPLDFAAMARRVVEQAQPALVKHAINLVQATAPVMVDGDEQRLEQVLQNLLNNAIKYSPDGGTVTVHVERKDGHAVLSVADEGIGIPEMARPHIFERFYRAGNVDRRNINGFGIGLYVVSEIVARHGGNVEVRSTEGSGTTFTVTLPLLSQDT